jgi:hypothetical protein
MEISFSVKAFFAEQQILLASANLHWDCTTLKKEEIPIFTLHE